MTPKLRDRWLLALAPPLAAGLIRFLGRTLRLETQGFEAVANIWAEGDKAIFVCWHDQLLLMPHSSPAIEATLLISASKDGELIARTLERLGHRAVRGSSSRGGRAAFRELLQEAAKGKDLALTPDGPRGPRRRAKPGAVRLARLTGRPVIPVAFVCSRGRRFASWDRFLLPYPWGRGLFLFGGPLWFDPGEEETTALERLQRGMEKTDQTARDALEAQGVSAV